MLEPFYGMSRQRSSSAPQFWGDFFLRQVFILWYRLVSNSWWSSWLCVPNVWIIGGSYTGWVTLVKFLIVPWLLDGQVRQDELEGLVTRPGDGQLMAHSSCSLRTPNLLSLPIFSSSGWWMRQEILCEGTHGGSHTGEPLITLPPMLQSQSDTFFPSAGLTPPLVITSLDPLCVCHVHLE